MATAESVKAKIQRLIDFCNQGSGGNETTLWAALFRYLLILSSQKPVLQPLTVTDNGTYTPPDGVDGFSQVDVNVDTSQGYDEGYGAGYLTGHDSGYGEGYNVGFADGQSSAPVTDVDTDAIYREGYDMGFSEGHEQGYQEGHEQGYQEGYDAGMASVTQG